MMSLRTSRCGIACAVVFLLFGTRAFGGTASVRSETREQEARGGRAENVQFQVGEGGIVRIFYDLVADNPQGLLGVRLVVSVDSGQTFDLVPSRVSGDVGAAIVPGPGKQIRWESLRDVERLDVDRIRVRLLITAIVAAVPRSSWAVSAALIPAWRMPGGLEKALFGVTTSDYRIGGSELRIGFARGRSESGDWGFALVMKRLQAGTFVARGSPVPRNVATTTYSVTDGMWLTGAEVYKFLPVLRLGRRHQLGVVVAAGAAIKPGGSVERRIDGAIFASDPFATATPRMVSQGPGVMVDDLGTLVDVPAGRTEVVDRVAARDLFHLSTWSSNPQVAGRLELAWAATLQPKTKLRVSGGLNYPALQIFSIEIVRFLGR
jgi:hypothetical protein